ncbi:MAG: ribose 5-phosphate isomerase B [Eggerthellaceae bacterium]|jgi:ribose 5-phosphate isomerase B|nr:ribose 5-phosphate isomerase B [Eggerthellaceae bacterium]
MIISIASDHAGFAQKQQLKTFLQKAGHTIIDRGPDNDDRVDYPDFAVLVAHDVAQGRAERGVLVCGTGIGMAMAADKVPGIRAATITTPQFATLCREHNNCNVIALSGRFVEETTNEQILALFTTTAFGGGRHAGRVEKIMRIDQESPAER